MIERQARDLEAQGSNPGPGSNFSLRLERTKQIRNKKIKNSGTY